MKIPIGGAPSAMGTAYSALATDAYAPVMNPAGLGFLNSTQVAGHHVSYFETSHFDFASLVVPAVLGGSIGASAQYFGTGDIAETDDVGNRLGTFSSHYGAYTLSYGRRWSEKLSLGVSGKWINAKIADVSANAYAADLGALYKVAPHVQSALVVSNAGSKLRFIDQKDSLPLTVKLGAAYLSPWHWTASAEGVYDTTHQASARFGAEWRALPLLALRGGYRTDTARRLSAFSGFSTGLGLFFWGNEFAYTWMPYGDLGETHSFAMLLKFGEKSDSFNIQTRQALRGEEDPEYESLKLLLVSTDTSLEAHP